MVRRLIKNGQEASRIRKEIMVSVCQHSPHPWDLRWMAYLDMQHQICNSVESPQYEENQVIAHNEPN